MVLWADYDQFIKLCQESSQYCYLVPEVGKDYNMFALILVLIAIIFGFVIKEKEQIK